RDTEKSTYCNSGVNLNSTVFASEYLRLQRLQGFYNYLWANVNIWYEVGLIMGCMLGNFGAVRYDSVRAVQQAFAGVILAYHLLHIWGKMGALNETSKCVLSTWECQKSDIWFRRFLAAAKPIRVELGSFFYADRGIKLTILATILENTMTLLISSA
ncbi:unnamed protein product, partial [Allacma fusca]